VPERKIIMAVCSNCKKEYDNLDKNCPECGQSREVQETSSVEDWVPLTKAGNDIEFEIIKDILEMAEIPVVRNVKGIDGFAQIILGVPLAGINILVPKDRYEEALQLLEAKSEEEFQDETEE
jgi:DNA-directed RNA polymerase subunit RPC12/RpoP